jgi:hypothetical protein
LTIRLFNLHQEIPVASLDSFSNLLELVLRSYAIHALQIVTLSLFIKYLLAVISFIEFFQQNCKKKIKENFLGKYYEGNPPDSSQSRAHCPIEVVVYCRLSIVCEYDKCGKESLHYIVEVIHRGYSLKWVQCLGHKIYTCLMREELHA